MDVAFSMICLLLALLISGAVLITVVQLTACAGAAVPGAGEIDMNLADRQHSFSGHHAPIHKIKLSFTAGGHRCRDVHLV